jgi:hypothetical protein
MLIKLKIERNCANGIKSLYAQDFGRYSQGFSLNEIIIGRNENGILHNNE